MSAPVPNFLAESSGDKFIVMWHENAAVAADAKNHVKARAFDGVTFGTEADLGQFVTFQSRMSGDGAGHAFAE